MTTRKATPDPKSFKRPESVLVVVYTRKGEVLLLQRADVSDAWQSVTGSMHWNEKDPIETAKRELHEETGLETEDGLQVTQVTNRYPIHPLWKPRYHPDETENREHLFFLELPDRVPVRLNQDEHRDACWLPFAQALERVRFFTNRDAIASLMENGS